MATPRRTGGALDIFQVDSITLADTWATGDTVVITIGVRDITVTLGATQTAAAMASGIAEAINGEDATTGTTRTSDGPDIPEFAEVEASLFSSTVVHVTAKTAGRPFTMSVAETTAGDGTATEASVTAAAGDEFWTGFDNWSTGANPADADTVYLDNHDGDIKFDLAQGDIEPTAVHIAQSYEGDIGLPHVNADGEEYPEYRPTSLRLGMAALQVGAGEGNGSGRIKIDSGDDICAVTVLNTGASADDLPAFLWKGSNASNSWVQRGGTAGVAVFGAETATLATVTVHDGSLLCGAGVTLSGAIVVNGGSVVFNSLIDGSLTMAGGQVAVEGTGNVDQLTIRGGACVLNTNGTLGGNTVVSGDGVLDLSQDSRALAGVTNPIEMYGTECRIIDPWKRLGNVVIDFNEGAQPGQVDWGQNLRLTRAATA